MKEEVAIGLEGAFTWLDTEGNDLSKIRKEERLPESVVAPVARGDKIGEVVYFLEEQKIGEVAVVASEDVPLATLRDTFQRAFGKWLLGNGKI